MILSASQPYFAPFPGFFYKAHRAHTLVILDEVQFPLGTTWISRNRFKNDQGTLWMTIPVQKKGMGLQRINEVRIYREGHWSRKHLQSLKTAYGKAPYFREHLEFVEEMFSGRFERLIDLNMAVIRHIMGRLKIETDVVSLSELGIDARGDCRLVEICNALGASQFLAQGAAGKYLDRDLFEKNGISLEFIRPPSPVYPQLWGNFIANLSALDLLFNCGPKARDIMIAG